MLIALGKLTEPTHASNMRYLYHTKLKTTILLNMKAGKWKQQI